MFRSIVGSAFLIKRNKFKGTIFESEIFAPLALLFFSFFFFYNSYDTCTPKRCTLGMYVPNPLGDKSPKKSHQRHGLRRTELLGVFIQAAITLHITYLSQTTESVEVKVGDWLSRIDWALVVQQARSVVETRLLSVECYHKANNVRSRTPTG